MYSIYTVCCIEFVRFSEGPLLEVYCINIVASSKKIPCCLSAKLPLAALFVSGSRV